MRSVHGLDWRHCAVSAGQAGARASTCLKGESAAATRLTVPALGPAALSASFVITSCAAVLVEPEDVDLAP
jgi:hypothetical protein